MAYQIMIVEDEYWTAIDMATEVADQGGTVIGPLSSLSEAVTLLHEEQRPDAAILDVNLRGADVFPFADMLVQRDIPFVFATGYGKDVLPKRFAHVPHLEKPLVVTKCVEMALALAALRGTQQPG